MTHPTPRELDERIARILGWQEWVPTTMNLSVLLPDPGEWEGLGVTYDKLLQREDGALASKDTPRSRDWMRYVPKWSEDAARANEIWAKLIPNWTFYPVHDPQTGTTRWVGVIRITDIRGEWTPGKLFTHGETLPLAVCRAIVLTETGVKLGGPMPTYWKKVT